MAVEQPRQNGFTALELAIGLLILVTLAVILANAYQTYTVRVQVDAGIVLADGLKPAIVKHLETHASLPRNRAVAGLSAAATDSYSDYVKSIAVVHGRLDITYGNSANPQIADAVLSITPYQAPDSTIIWRCGRAATPTDGAGAELEIAGGSESQAVYRPGSVPERYQPGTCR